jgi:hypothetical protein
MKRKDTAAITQRAMTIFGPLSSAIVAGCLPNHTLKSEGDRRRGTSRPTGDLGKREHKGVRTSSCSVKTGDDGSRTDDVLTLARELCRSVGFKVQSRQ